MTDVPIRAAATTILLRDLESGSPQVLMGQRGSKAAFMPNKFVFPGGAVDLGDADIPLSSDISTACRTRLDEDSDGTPPNALIAAAIRELWEETGLILGQSGDWDDPPEDWETFAKRGYRPCAKGLHFFFRAITPPGRSRRFDARFFLADAGSVVSDLDDFGAACEELSHLQWVPLAEVRSLNLPFITSVVLGELAGLTQISPPATVPFFKNEDEQSLFLRLGTA